jgi:uncharacterized protein (TIGR03083 family)
VTMPGTDVVVARAIPRTDQHQAYDLRAAEIAAWNTLLRSLDSADWHRPTPCTAWDVADIVGHMIGQAEDVLYPWRVFLRNRRARRRYPEVQSLDGHGLVQADEHRGTPPAALRARFAVLWRRTNRTLRRTPRLVRRFQIPSGIREIPRVPLDWVLDVVVLRDLWMHRNDICEATGRPFVIGAHDRAVVEQVVRDLDSPSYGPFSWRGPAVVLELTGEAGGVWHIGDGDAVATVRADAVAYMRTLSGRDDHPIIEVASGDPAAGNLVAAARFPF